MNSSRSILIVALSIAIICGCNTPKNNDKNNRLTKEEKEGGWELLFDGTSLKGWRVLGYSEGQQCNYWRVENGAIRRVNNQEVEAKVGSNKLNGDLISTDVFDSFELVYEWKVNPAGNSGIKYNVSEELSMKYGSGHGALGFEYQELDDGSSKYQGENRLKPTQYSAALYDMIAPKNVHLKPVGQYNRSRIVIRGNRGEHWLNGVKVLEYEFGTAQFDSLYNHSKYKKYPNFEKKIKGHIVITGHNDDSWHRNIKVRKL